MSPIDVLRDGFGRIGTDLPPLLEGLTPTQLSQRLSPQANTIGWLVWHLLRVQDDHIAEVADSDQVWTSHGFADRFGLPFEDSATGYGHSSDDVAQVQTTAALLSEYADAVGAATSAYLDTLTAEELDRIVDRRWDPPVTLGARLVSVINDDTQHLGQAAFVRGVIAP